MTLFCACGPVVCAQFDAATRVITNDDASDASANAAMGLALRCQLCLLWSPTATERRSKAGSGVARGGVGDDAECTEPVVDAGVAGRCCSSSAIPSTTQPCVPVVRKMVRKPEHASSNAWPRRHGCTLCALLWQHIGLPLVIGEGAASAGFARFRPTPLIPLPYGLETGSTGNTHTGSAHTGFFEIFGLDLDRDDDPRLCF